MIACNYVYVYVRGINIVKQLNWVNVVQIWEYCIDLAIVQYVNVMSHMHVRSAITMCII